MNSVDIVIEGKKYREIRCYKCRKKLGYEYVFSGRIAFECPRCGEWLIINNFDIKNINKVKNLPGFKLKT